MKNIFIFLAFLLSSCSTLNTSNKQKSFVDSQITQEDAAKIANDIIEYLSKNLPPAKTTLLIDSPSKNDPINPLLIEGLRQKGFGISQNKQTKSTEISMHYLVSQMDSGIFLNIKYLQNEASRFYAKNQDGKLSKGVFTIRKQ